MSILSGLGKTVEAISKPSFLLAGGTRGLGRAVETLGKPSSLMAIGAGSFALGMFNKAAPAARDALLGVSMGDPNADVAFTGRKLDPTFIAGQYMGGFAKTLGNAVNPTDFAATGAPLAQTVGFMGSPAGIAAGAAATFGGGAVGTGVDGYAGFKLAKKFGKKGLAAGLVGGLVGGMVGATTGATAGPIAMAAGVSGHVKNN